jgi:hypothetical protein
VQHHIYFTLSAKAVVWVLIISYTIHLGLVAIVWLARASDDPVLEKLIYRHR